MSQSSGNASLTWRTLSRVGLESPADLACAGGCTSFEEDMDAARFGRVSVYKVLSLTIAVPISSSHHAPISD